MNYAGISEKALDSITIKLKFETAHDLCMCQTAADYWADELDFEDLEITPARVREFMELEDGGLDARNGKVDVQTWVICVEDSTDLPHKYVVDTIDQVTKYTPAEICRALKAALLACYDMRTFERLGGKLRLVNTKELFKPSEVLDVKYFESH